jgi:cation diffusion facilitator CzcD-associated flavoprotein CzcO
VNPVDRTNRVCVLGAGSSGLTAAKNLLDVGIPVDVLEREDDLGGNWNYGKGNSRVYRSTHTISSKKCTQYTDFPMPRDFPEFPNHTQILEYLRSYAAHFGLARVIEYGRPISLIEPFDGGRAWDVRLEDGEVRRYGAVIIANGHNWSPKFPSYPGQFSGQVIHTAQYKTPDVLANKRVLVVGAGNSGCDLAVEAAQNARRAVHSTRRGYHYVPKFILGQPSDRLGDKLHKLRLPLGLRRWIINLCLKIVAGSPKRYQLPEPDHKLFETHPIINSLLLYYLGHGDITPKPDIARFDEVTVHFVDGTHEEFDLIVYATGYNIVFPFIDNQWLNWRDGRPHLYKNVFHPEFDNLFVAGLIQPDSGQFGLVDWQMKAVALFLRARVDGSRAAAHLQRLKQRPEEDLGAGIHFKDSSRHLVQVEHWSYRKGLEKLIREMTALGSAQGAA